MPTYLKLAILGLTTLLSLLICMFSLEYNHPTVIQNILFVPIVVSSFLFRKKGFFYSLIIIGVYSFIIIFRYGFLSEIGPLSIRVAFFIFISGMVSILLHRLVKTEKSLNESTQLWNFAIEATGDAVWNWDMKNQLVYFSGRYKELFGYTETAVEVDEKYWRKIIHAEDYDQLVKDFNDYISGNTKIYKNERRILCADGNYKWILDRGKLLERSADGQPLRMIGTFSDITERKTIELENQRISKLIEDERSLFLAGPVIVFKWKNEPFFPIEYVSKNIEEVLGYSYEQFVSKEILMKDILYKDDLERLKTEIEKEGSQGVFAFKHNPYRLLNKKGKIVWFYDYTISIRNEKGEITHYIGYLIDISSKMETEIALQESNEKYKLLVDNISDLIYRTDINNNIVFVSPSIYNSLGSSSDQIIGQKYFPNTHEEDIKNISIQLEKLSEPPYECFFETRILTEEGWNWFAWRVKNQFDHDGNVIGKVGIGRNITALKSYQEVLQDSELKFRMIAENAPFPLMIRNLKDGLVLYMNIKAEILLECKREDIVNKEKIFRFYYNPADITKLTDILLKEGNIKDFEMQFQTYQGKIIWIIVSLNMLNYFNAEAVASSYVDITDRKTSDIKLRESEERYRVLAENASDMISKHDLFGKYLYVSSNCGELTGYSQEELLGKEVYNFIVDEDIPAFSESIESTIETSLSKSIRWRFIKKDSSRVWIESTIKTIINTSTGDLSEIIAVNRDITERVLAEEKQINLERKILQAQKFESLGVMAAGIAHDYNTFLLGIMGNLELASLFVDKESKTYGYIQKSLMASKNASNITRQILTFLGHAKFVLKNFSLNEVVMADKPLLNNLINDKTQIVINLNNAIPNVQIDETLISQALFNIVSNSVEAVKDGTGIITISTGIDYLSEEDILSSRLNEKPEPGYFVYLKIDDNGVGMDSKNLLRIFEPFYTTKATGRGLGTAAVLGIVRIHKGVIFVDSEQGKGTMIKLGFPVV